MKNKTNKNFYLFEETIKKLEHLAQANNCRNVSNYLDLLIENESKRNQQLGKTDRDILVHMVELMSTMSNDISNHTNKIDRWGEAIGTNFRIIGERVESLKANQDIPAPNLDSKQKEIFNNVAFENQQLKAENERYKRLEQSFSHQEEQQKEMRNIKNALFLYRKVSANKSKITQEDWNKLSKCQDDVKNFFATLKPIINSLGIQMSDISTDQVLEHFKSRIMEMRK